MMKAIAALVLFASITVAVHAGPPSVTNYSPAAASDNVPKQTMNSGMSQYITYLATGTGTGSVTLTAPNLQTTVLNKGIYPYSGTQTGWKPLSGGTVTIASGTASATSRTFGVTDLSNVSTPPPACFADGVHLSPCVELIPSGDDAIGSSTSGFADPSMRRDPNAGTLWMSYSHPTTTNLGPVIEIHLAKSTNGGSVWNFVQKLYTTADTYSCKMGQQTSHEVSNLWPHGANWYIIHAEYCADPGYSLTHFFSQGEFLLAEASSPTTLESAPSSTADWTFSAMTDEANSLLPQGHTALSCDSGWNEPAFFVQNSTRYVSAQCVQAVNGGPGFYVFQLSNTSLDLVNVAQIFGPFGTNADVQRLTKTTSTSQFYTQLDVAQRANDSGMIAIATLSDSHNGIEVHKSCQVLAFNPTAAPASSILTAVNAYIPDTTHSTLTGGGMNLGQGACTYEPTSPTGLLVVKRDQGLVVHMIETGVMP